MEPPPEASPPPRLLHLRCVVQHYEWGDACLSADADAESDPAHPYAERWIGFAVASAVKVGKKRGRPRKYGLDGRQIRPLNAPPISTSVSMVASTVGLYTSASAVGTSMKRGMGHPLTSPPRASTTTGSSSASTLTPLDVTMKDEDSSGGTLTYEGRFELHMPTENSGTRSRSGGMSVSLASPDGRVVVGGVAGLLVEASPVQIVVGSFLPSYQMEQKNKKPRVDAPPAPAQTPPAVPISSTNTLSSEQGQQMRKKVICTMLLVNLVVSRACISIWNASLDMPRYFDADYYRRRQRVEKKDGMNFIESVIWV